MNIKALSTSALLLAVGLSSAQAATTVAGDVLLGFRAYNLSTGGSTFDVETNLGSASQFYNTAATDSTALVDLTSRLSVADLSNTFGSTWANNLDVRFGLAAGASQTAATAGQVKNTVWFSNQRADALVQSKSLAEAGTQTSWLGVIQKYQGLSGSKLAQSYTAVTTAGSNAYTVIADGSQAGSYTKSVTPTAYFGSSTLTQNAEKDTTASLNTIGNAWSLTDFYILNPVTGGTATYAGTFALALVDGATTSTGASYNAGSLLYELGSVAQFVAIPEPSTYAAILGALTVGFVALRRRFSKAV